jgi:chromosome segregation ATPase
MFRRLLLSALPADGGNAAPPPAAERVLNSDVTESDAAELVRLRREVAELKEKHGETTKLVKSREQRIAELEDENRTLKTIPAAPAPAKQAAAVKKGWLEGNTFFG